MYFAYLGFFRRFYHEPDVFRLSFLYRQNPLCRSFAGFQQEGGAAPRGFQLRVDAVRLSRKVFEVNAYLPL